jgi:hypothetical protein
MDKSIENIINPSLLESIRKLQKQMSFAASVFQESETIRTIRKFSAESTIFASQGSEALRAIRSFQSVAERVGSSTSRLALFASQESEALKAMRSFQSVAERVRSSGLSFLQSETAKRLQNIAKMDQILSSIALQQSKIFQISNLTSFKALDNLYNSPFSKDEVLAFASEIDGGDGIADKFFEEIDDQISAEIASKTDFNTLSDKAKKILLYFFNYVFLPLFLNAVYDAYKETKKELKSIATPTEVKQFVRSSNDKFDRSLLKGFRVTTVESLNFRKSPSMRSEIITILPIGSLVEIIDKSNRSWLLVEVEIDGELEQGWVPRRYTAHFK